MSNYTKTTNFATKDNLSPGNPLKIVKGAEIDTEFNNIQTAVATKTDNSAAAITGGSITGITDLAVADGGTGLSSGTSGGVLAFTASGTLASSSALAANALVIGGGAGVAPSTTTTGTGAVTALGVNIGSAGSFVVNGGVLGTPSSGTAANLTGLPISTGVSGLGTGVATALAVNVGSAGAPLVNGGVLGTPSSGTATNLTGLPLSTGVTGTLPVLNGGTGTATPSIVAGTNVTVSGAWPNQTIAASGGVGTVTSVALSGGTTGLTVSGSPITSSGTITVAGTLAVANGGTGETSYTNGQLLIGNTTGNTLTKATLTAGTGVTITNGTGSITIAASGGSGDVVGPSSATDNAITRFDLTTGKLVQNSLVTVADDGAITAPQVGSVIPFYYANQAAFPSASTYHGALAHSHADGAMYFAHSSAWYRLLDATTAVTPAQGGTGVANNAAMTVTGSGNFAYTRTLTGTTNVTFPTTGTLSTLAGTETLTNKTLTSPTLTTPALGTPASGTLSSCTVDGTDAVGFRNIPINSQSTAYTLVLADSGKTILHPASDANARTFTIPANSSVAYPIGTAVTFINMTSQVVTIAITTDTMYLSDAGTTGSRSLAQYGSATAIKITSTNWLISGSGLT